MVKIEQIHHVSLIVTDLERAKQFYETVIGLKPIARPAFDFPGAWYAVGHTGQQLHLIVHNGETKRTKGIDTRDGHFAVRVESYGRTIAWLEAHNVEYKAKPDSITGFAQIFVTDPDRNIIELNAERITDG